MKNCFILREKWFSDLLENDPNLELSGHRGLKEHFQKIMRGKVWRRIS